MKFAAIIEETFREAKARKTLVGFFIFSLIIILLTFGFLQVEAVQEVLKQTEPAKKGAPPPAAGAIVLTVLDYAWIILSVMIFFMTVAIGVFTTASFMSSMMEKGNIDLLLSKPVPRYLYILGRYTGALCIIAFEVVVFMLGMWIVIGISLGRWEMTFLNSIVFILVGFGGIYSIVTLVTVITKSSWFAIIIGIAGYFLSIMLLAADFLKQTLTGEEASGLFKVVLKVFYYILPQEFELAQNMKFAITGEPIQWAPVGLTLLLVAVYLSLSSYLFSKKEF